MSLLSAKPADPGKPHAFVARSDAGLAAMASGGLGRGPTDPTALAVTSAYQRDDQRCALEGCGRPRYDDIHALAAD